MKGAGFSMWLAALVAVAAAGMAFAHEGHDHEEKAAAAEMTPEAMQQYMEKYATPGPEHQWFDFFVGDWTYESRMWMAPGGEPMKSAGKASFGLELGGRYLLAHHEGSFMDQPFQGRGISGYDRLSGEYFSLWFDNMGTGYLLSKGERSADGKSLTVRGAAKDPMTGEMMKHRMVETITGENAFSMEMFHGEAGAEAKVMQIDYARAAKGGRTAKK